MSRITEFVMKEVKAMEAKHSELSEMQPYKLLLILQLKKKDQGYHSHYHLPDITTANDLFIGLGDKLNEARVNKSGLIIPKSWMD